MALHCRALLLLLCVATIAATAPSAKFQGTAMQGIDKAMMLSGGATLIVQLSSSSFDTSLSNAAFQKELSASLTSLDDLPSGWNSQREQVLETSKIEFMNHRKTMKVTFGASLQYNASKVECINILIPKRLILDADVDLKGPEFCVLPNDVLSIEVVNDWSVITKPVSVRFSGADAALASGAFPVVSGTGCKGKRVPMSGQPTFDKDARLFTFVPLIGGTFSMCYPSSSSKSEPEYYVKAKREITVAGPDAFSTDIQPRSQVEFTATFYGTNLSERDTVVFTKKQCEKLLEEDIVESYDVFLLSSTRATCSPTLAMEGHVNVCYLRQGADTHATIASIVVQRGSSQMIDGDLSEFSVQADTLVLRSVHIGVLTVVSGHLSIEHHQLNVTHFNWAGGTISATTGSINCFGASSVAMGTEDISFSLKNFGKLTVSFGSLRIRPQGAIENYGHLTLVPNATKTSPASIHSESRRGGLFNAYAATLAFELRTEGILSLDTLQNQGNITVQGGELRITSLSSSGFSYVFVESDTTLLLVSGVVEGSMIVEDNATVQFSGGPIRLRSTSITNPSTGGDGSVLHFSDGQVFIDGITVRGDVTALFHGTVGLRLGVSGVNMFGATVTVAMHSAKLESSSVAHLNLEGRFLCHVPSVDFGDNIAIHANLQSVLFGSEEDGKAARIVPQKIPQNTSFIVPPSATLVVMNLLSEYTRYSARVCPFYVVIPVHIESSGRVLLWGCAMLPFGGVHSGVVQTMTAAEIEATVRYAFCRKVLTDGSFCSKLFMEHESVTASGLAVGGTHYIDNLKVEIDDLRIDDGQVVSLSPVKMNFRERLVISSAGVFVARLGGNIHSNHFEVYGVLDGSAVMPLLIDSSLSVENGTLRVDVDPEKCSFPMTITGALDFAARSKVQCVRQLNRSVGTTAGLLQASSIKGTPLLDEKSCSSEYRVGFVQDAANLGIQFSYGHAYPSDATKFTVMLFAVTAAIGVFLLLVLRMTPRLFIAELGRRLPFSLHLSWGEYAACIPNFFATASMLFDAILLAASAFHPLVPLPHGTEYAIRMSTSVMFVHKLSLPSTPVSLILEIALIVMWIVTWIPLTGRRFSHQLKDLLYNRENLCQRYAIQLLFQFHIVASFVGMALFLPILSTLMDSVACATFLSEVDECKPLAHYVVAALPLALGFMFLAPYSGSSCSFPFSHPPYLRSMDIRYKRTFLFLQSFLFSIQVFVWKVFAHEPLELLVASLLIQLLLLGLHTYSAPCAYANITSMKNLTLLFPLWATLCSLIQLARHGVHSRFVCAQGDPLYLVMLFGGWILIGVCIVFVVKQCSRGTLEYFLNTDPGIATHLTKLTDTHEKITSCSLALYNSASSRDREEVSENLSGLRIKYLQILNQYRRKKERYLLPYYLGDAIAGPLLAAQLEIDDDHNAPVVAVEVPMKPMRAEVPDSPDDIPDLLLHPEEMENFIRGPPLGRGSFGAVYMGMLPSGKLVAVKEVALSHKTKVQLPTVKKEVNMLRQLVHPNVIRYYGCHSTAKSMYIFMEFAVGGSLTSLVRKFDRLTEPVIQQYTYQILCGLEYLHSKNVVHRDVKGENILIDGQGVAKLADFGCSKALADIANKSQAGCASLVGSPYWMAPEVIRSEAYGTKADIWSVGCTVVEMLNGGETPWHEKFDNVYSAMYFVGNTNEIPSNIPSDVSESCRDFLSRCFERDVSKRASSSELLKHPWLCSHGAVPKTSPDQPVPQSSWERCDSGSEVGRTEEQQTHSDDSLRTQPADSANSDPARESAPLESHVVATTCDDDTE